ncbi:MAG: pilus assembly protein TadG-related protein [Gemmataceae bacterium]|nr:pilus assembly protein TadG-related protein [Gemmataceae bacterium]
MQKQATCCGVGQAFQPDGLRARQAGKPDLRQSQSGRRGTVLAYFALVVVVLLGLGALVIDLGLARMTQRQLQSAADAAALEGMRLRDDPDKPDPQTREAARREAASRVVAEYFAGAPPLLELTGGIPVSGTDFRASQRITQGKPTPYQQGLKPNLDNDPAGDLVSGKYLAGPTITHREENDYERDDFVPGDGEASGFLVRLRMTGETPDEGTAGPRVPILFGRGSLIRPDTKARGVAVRATAIASARPVWSVGAARPEQELRLEGYTPFALEQSAWAAFGMDAVTVAVSGGVLTRDGKQVGRLLKVGRIILVGTRPADMQGDATELSRLTAEADRKYYAYVPVYASIDTTELVVGLGRLDIEQVAGDLSSLVLRRRPGVIAPRNVSASLVSAVDSADFQKALQAHQEFKKQDPVLAPVLVR